MIYCCSACHQGWQLLGEHEEVSSMVRLMKSEAGSFPCITPLCAGRLVATSGLLAGTRSVKELPVRSFYRAIHGFGTGEGDPASVEEFARLLKTMKIVDLSVTAIGQPERVIVHQLVLEDGTRLHFDSSTRGACCFYIERPGKTCVEVVEDELSSDEAAVPSPDPHREEVGRGDADTEGPQEPEQSASIPFDAGPQPTGAVPMRAVFGEADLSRD